MTQRFGTAPWPTRRVPRRKEKPEKCIGCPLYGERGPVWATGPEDAQIALVGEAPGPDELVDGKPFVGRAGWVLDIGLKAAGVDRGLCYITNVVKCMPSVPGKPDQFRKPTRREIQHCASAYLDDEIKKVNPNVVVALGEAALSWLGRNGIVDEGLVKMTDMKKITEWRGTVLEVPDE